MDASTDSRAGNQAESPGIQGRPESVRRPYRTAHGSHRLVGRLYGVVRVTGRTHRHQPSLCHRRPAVQLHAGTQPAEGRLSGKDPRRRVAECAGIPRPCDDRCHRGHRCHHGEYRPEGNGPRALRPYRPEDKGAHRRLRDGRTTLQRGVVLWWVEVLRDRPDGDQGRAAGLRARRGDRCVRRRNRQLAVAPAYRGLEFSARLCRQGREAGCILQRKRSVQAQALAEGVDRRDQAGGSGFRDRLPGTHRASPDLLGGEGNNRVELAPLHTTRAGTTGDPRPAHEEGCRPRAEGFRASAGLEQHFDKTERRAGGAGARGEAWQKNRHRRRTSRPGSRPIRSARRSMATYFQRYAPFRPKPRRRASGTPR